MASGSGPARRLSAVAAPATPSGSRSSAGAGRPGSRSHAARGPGDLASLANALSASVNVFTYGSLMYEAVWSRVVRGQYPWVAARLPGFRRLAIRDAAYPAVVPGAVG